MAACTKLTASSSSCTYKMNAEEGYEPSPTSVVVKRVRPAKLCSICGKPAKHRCRKCPALYCSAECRDIDVTSNDHERICCVDEPDEVGGTSLFGLHIPRATKCGGGPLLQFMMTKATEASETQMPCYKPDIT